MGCPYSHSDFSIVLACCCVDLLFRRFTSGRLSRMAAQAKSCALALGTVLCTPLRRVNALQAGLVRHPWSRGSPLSEDGCVCRLAHQATCRSSSCCTPATMGPRWTCSRSALPWQPSPWGSPSWGGATSTAKTGAKSWCGRGVQHVACNVARQRFLQRRSVRGIEAACCFRGSLRGLLSL